MKEINSSKEFTRHRLMMTALKLFSEKNIASVTVREIVSAAGAKNNGAVYYHFGNKDKLVEELFHTIQTKFDEVRNPMIKEAGILARQNKLALAHIAEILVFPYVMLIETEEWGHWATRFLARSLMNTTPQTKKAIELNFRKSARDMSNLLPCCLPQVPEKILLSRFNFMAVAVIHGFSEYKSLNNSYFGDLSYTNLKDLANIYKSCVVASLSAPVDAECE